MKNKGSGMTDAFLKANFYLSGKISYIKMESKRKWKSK